MRWYLFPVVTATRKFMQAATNILVREFIFWNLTIPTPSGGQRLSITEFITLDKYHQTRCCIHHLYLWEYRASLDSTEATVLCCWNIRNMLFSSNVIFFSTERYMNPAFGVMIKRKSCSLVISIFFPCKKNKILCLLCWINEGVVYTYIFLIDVIQAL